MSRGNGLILIGCIILLCVSANFFIHTYKSQQLLKQVKASVGKIEPDRNSNEIKNTNSANELLVNANETLVGTTAKKQNTTEIIANNQLQTKDTSTTDPAQQQTDVEANQTNLNVAITNASAIGIMKISKIDLELPILEGMSTKTLQVALGHDKNSGYPGEIGNFVVSGHRAYVYGQFFNRLDEVEIKDTIEISTKEGNYKYEVKEISVVTPDDLSVTEPTENATITLITCTPIHTGTHRLIVRGELVPTNP